MPNPQYLFKILISKEFYRYSSHRCSAAPGRGAAATAVSLPCDYRGEVRMRWPWQLPRVAESGRSTAAVRHPVPACDMFCRQMAATPCS